MPEGIYWHVHSPRRRRDVSSPHANGVAATSQRAANARQTHTTETVNLYILHLPSVSSTYVVVEHFKTSSLEPNEQVVAAAQLDATSALLLSNIQLPSTDGTLQYDHSALARHVCVPLSPFFSCVVTCRARVCDSTLTCAPAHQLQGATTLARQRLSGDPAMVFTRTHHYVLVSWS